MIRAACIALSMIVAQPWSAAWAQSTDGMLGRIVTFSVLAYDDAAAPLFVGTGQTVKVSDGIEFGLGAEGAQNGLDVVPVQVNISRNRVEVSFADSPPGTLARAVFNGYVLRFETDCVLFDKATIDRKWTTLPLADTAIAFAPGSLFINVSGLRFDRQSRFAVDLSLTECGLS